VDKEKRAFLILKPVIVNLANKSLFYLKNYLAKPESYEPGTCFVEYKRFKGVTLYILGEKNTGSVLSPLFTIPFLRLRSYVSFAVTLIDHYGFK